MYQITKVEGVNRILTALDGTIVSDLTDPQNSTVINVLRAIDIVTDKIQIENQWNFNFDGPRTLLADGDDEISIPTDTIFIRFIAWTNGNYITLTTKEDKVWDRKLGSSAVGGSVQIVGQKKLTYEEVPAVIQNLIIEKAKLEYVGGVTHLSAPRLEIYMASLREAYQAALKWDSDQAGGNMGLTQDFRSKRTGANRRGWWWGW